MLYMEDDVLQTLQNNKKDMSRGTHMKYLYMFGLRDKYEGILLDCKKIW